VEPVVIGVQGPADRLLMRGLSELAPVLEALGPGATIIGGLMVRVWLHAKPTEIPGRTTADIDVGIDKRSVGITGERRVVAPLLEAHGFKPGYGGEPFRYVKEVEGHDPIIVDVVIAPGASRTDPPLLEPGLETIRAPGLAYAQHRGPVAVTLRFVDGDEIAEFPVHVPPLDAAFVLKAALAVSGVRTRPDRVQSDSVDSILLAAACLTDPPSIAALREHRSRSDVRKALRWTAEAFRSPTASGARRVDQYVEGLGGGIGGGSWAHEVAQTLGRALGAQAA
jgi:hypothetical protein